MKNRLAAIVAICAMTVSVVPAGVAAAPFQAGLAGQIRGDVNQKCGQALPVGLQAQLVDAQGTAVPGMTTPVVAGAFAFSNVAPGVYTVHVIGGSVGMTAVTVTAGRVSNANITVGTEQCARWNKTTKLIVAAAIVGGVTLIVATRGEASPSR